MPLFPELKPLLQTAYDEAPDFDKNDPNTEFVIHRCLDRGANLRTHMQRIVRRAGVAPWPKLFQNLRSTRQTELSEKYPIHVVCAWLGNSQAIAAKHYLQVRDEDFAAAAGEDALPKAMQQEVHTKAQSETVSTLAGGVPLYASQCNSLLTIQCPLKDSNLGPAD